MSARPFLLCLMLLSLLAFAPQARGDERFPGVLPRPKQYHETGAPLRLAAANEIITITLHGDDRILHAAANALIERITAAGCQAKIVASDGRIRLGTSADWPKDIALTVAAPPHEQGYGLLVSKGDHFRAGTIAIIGSDPLGAYYGAQTLIQLMEGAPAEGMLVRHVKITDWPSFAFRAFKSQRWQYRDNRMFASWAPRFKLNVLASCYTDSIDWRAPPQEYQAMLKDISEIASDGGAIEILQLGNPYLNKDRPISADSREDLAALLEFFELSLAAGSRSIMLCLDDFAVMVEDDRAAFPTLASANAQIVNQLHAALRAKYPDAKLMVCPPPYWLNANQRAEYAWAHDYLREFCAAIPKDVIIVWTGAEVNTICQRVEDIRAYQSLIGSERQLMLWDNTIKFPPGWSNVFRVNAFAAECANFASSAWPGMHGHVNGRAIINTYAPGEFSKIALMTAADYLWNPEQYDAADALKRALYWFHNDRGLGPLILQLANHGHQELFDQRLEYMRRPSPEKLAELKQLCAKYEQQFEMIKSKAGPGLVADLEPYVLRHTLAMPICERVLSGYQQRRTNAAAAIEQLKAAASDFQKLIDDLARKGPAAERNGCVKPVLEQKAINTLRRWVRQASERQAGLPQPSN